MTDWEPLIPWRQPGWFERASAWVHAELERRGIAVSAPIDQPHSYPWSCVLRVPTSEGDIYFKAVSPAHPHEPALLGRWRAEARIRPRGYCRSIRNEDGCLCATPDRGYGR